MPIIIAYVTTNPTTVLYAFFGLTYVAAIIVAWRAGHRGLAVCYTLMAILYASLTACHHMHLD